MYDTACDIQSYRKQSMFREAPSRKHYAYLQGLKQFVGIYLEYICVWTFYYGA